MVLVLLLRWNEALTDLVKTLGHFWAQEFCQEAIGYLAFDT